jgi:hypothetical protein
MASVICCNCIRDPDILCGSTRIHHIAGVPEVKQHGFRYLKKKAQVFIGRTEEKFSTYLHLPSKAAVKRMI